VPLCCVDGKISGDSVGVNSDAEGAVAMRLRTVLVRMVSVVPIRFIHALHTGYARNVNRLAHILVHKQFIDLAVRAAAGSRAQPRMQGGDPSPRVHPRRYRNLPTACPPACPHAHTALCTGLSTALSTGGHE
jgi:hypothetical protein